MKTVKPLAALLCALSLAACAGTTPPPPGDGDGGSEACPAAECALLPAQEQKLDCDDGDPKTLDRCASVEVVSADCRALVCTHSPVECDHYDLAPAQQASCDDGDPCTDDRCDAHNACVHSHLKPCP